MSKLHDTLNRGLQSQPQPRGPLWEGPEGKGPNGGVTQSLLQKFLRCRERARIYLIEGLQPKEEFNHRTFFGIGWHLCEQCLAAEAPTRSPNWEHALLDYARAEARRWPLQAQQIDHWTQVIRVAFPLYVDYWSTHDDVQDRTPLLQEQVFDVPYSLPSGRTVRLRGRWDAVDLIGGKGKGQHTAGIYLFESKTKGEVAESLIKRQLLFDLQTMLYTVALTEYQVSLGQYRLGGTGIPRGVPIAGVRYNVIRRPLSGGKGSIVRHKPSKSNPQGESKEEFYGRLHNILAESPQEYFFRWNVSILPSDVARFRKECLDPILEQLCDWYTQMVTSADLFEDTLAPGDPRGFPNSLHFRTPYTAGTMEGWDNEVEEYLASGSTIGMERVEKLFGELDDAPAL